MPNTTMATSTEVEGEMTVDAPPELEQSPNGPAAEADGENITAVSEDEESQPEETTGETDPKLSEGTPPRGERRMGKLIDKLKERTEEASALRMQLDQFKQGSQKEPSQPDYGTNQIIPPWEQQTNTLGEEVTPEQYREHVLGAADGIVQARLSEYQKNISRFEDFKSDLNEVEQNYAILNPKSEQYDSEKSKTVAQLWEKASKADPELRLQSFVKQIMSFHQAGQQTGKQEVTSKVIQQTAEGAVPPSVSGSNKSGEADWDSMTYKEKETWMKENGIWDQ